MSPFQSSVVELKPHNHCNHNGRSEQSKFVKKAMGTQNEHEP